MCKYCGAIKEATRQTCDNSYCQESNYLENQIRNTRPGSKERKQAAEKYAHNLQMIYYQQTGQI